MTSDTAPPDAIDALTRAGEDLGRVRQMRPAFEAALEERYEAFSSDGRNRALRFWLLFGLFLRVLGLLNEYAVGGELVVYGLVFRLALLVPLALVCLWFLSPRYSVLAQGIAATATPFACVVGIALLGTIAPAPNEVRYFFLAGVNLVAVNLVMPLRFPHALAYTLVSIIAFASIAFSGLGNVEARSVADIVFLYSLAGIASLAVVYRNDIADRRAFLAHEQIRLQGAALARANEELRAMLTTDALTGVHNRRHLDQCLESSCERAIRERTYLGLVMVDVDHFKAFNDLLGHRAGDECLREVARAITANVREGRDIVTRYGGEEFAVLVPELPLDAMQALGERIRAAVEALEIPHPRVRDARVTVSVGVTAFIPEGPDALARLINGADSALYSSKHQGRNRVTQGGVLASGRLDSTARLGTHKFAV